MKKAGSGPGEYGTSQGEAYVHLGARPDEAMAGFTEGQLTALKCIFAALAFTMFATIFYTCWTDGSPFRKELLVPWMVATLYDFYLNQGVIFLWAFYKEDTALMRVLVGVAMVCLGSLATCLYVLYQLTKLSPGQGMRELLLNPRHLLTSK